MDDFSMGLTTNQSDKIIQFQELTGIENVTVCRDILQRHGWDIEVAVQDQLNIREGRPTVFASEANAPQVVTDTVAQQVFFSPPSGRRFRWEGTFGYIASFVFHLCFDTVSSVLKIFYRLFWQDTRRQVTDPIGDVLRFMRYFDETFGPSHPVFYQGSYSQALNDAKQELRFLLIYLHCDNNQDCNNFCSGSLSDSDLITYVNSNMLFWACSVSSGEGYRVSQALQDNTYPFLAVICLRESRMTVVGRQEGPVTAQELMQRLQAIVSANEHCLVAARAERVERSFNQTLRQQQDEAYMESLLADQEKERLRSIERERAEGEERRRREFNEQERLRKEELQKQKLDRLSEVPSEPPPNHPEAVCVVFKMPSGDRLERRFLHTHTLRDVFNYVFCHPASPDSFEIATNFPKRVLKCTDNGRQTLSDAGLKRGEVLFVYDLEA